LALVALLVACGGAEPRRAGDAVPLAVVVGSAGGAADKLRAGDLPAARAGFEATLASDPEGLTALNDLAASYLVEGHGEAARRLLDDVVARGTPREQQAALVNLGELYALDGYQDAARAYLETARAIDRERPEPWYALALLDDGRGDAPRAHTALREALRLDEGGAARSQLVFAFPEERTHLEALLAEQAGDATTAQARWRELGVGSFAPLATAAERHLRGE
jgi:tetratricopeptide (TPR) repeat protein